LSLDRRSTVTPMIERSVLLGLKPMLLLANGVTVTISRPDEVPSDESAFLTNPDPIAMRLVVPVAAIASVPESSSVSPNPSIDSGRHNDKLFDPTLEAARMLRSNRSSSNVT
jgi:hypothetical protein